MDKVIDKAVFDAVILLARDYWNSPYRDDSKTRLEVISNFLRKHFREYICLYEFLQMTISKFGVNPEATNEEIYKALECLGWRVEDEKQVS